MKMITLKTTTITIAFLISSYLLIGQCAIPTNIYTFSYNGKNYDIIKENKSWIDAAKCAVERGGVLIEINDSLEQNAIFNELVSNANITHSNTVAPDGGGGAYVWIGGNDIATEGTWIWDGDNDGSGAQFWMGDRNGRPVGGLYNNWGDEPDDSGGQDGLGLSLNGWPYGKAGEWNDVDNTNTLYYIVEHPSTLSINDFNLSKIKMYPNPVVDFLTIETKEMDLFNIEILNSLGQKITATRLNSNSGSEIIDLSYLKNGIYFVKINLQNGESIIKKISK